MTFYTGSDNAGEKMFFIIIGPIGSTYNIYSGEEAHWFEHEKYPIQRNAWTFTMFSFEAPETGRQYLSLGDYEGGPTYGNFHIRIIKQLPVGPFFLLASFWSLIWITALILGEKFRPDVWFARKAQKNT